MKVLFHKNPSLVHFPLVNSGGKGFILYAAYDPSNGGEVSDSGGASLHSGKAIKPRMFCAGGDLATVRQCHDADGGRKMAALMHDAARRLRSLPLVSACVVDGRARFREILCAVSDDHGEEFPDHMPCEEVLTRAGIEPQPTGQPVNLGFFRDNSLFFGLVW